MRITREEYIEARNRGSRKYYEEKIKSGIEKYSTRVERNNLVGRPDYELSEWSLNALKREKERIEKLLEQDEEEIEQQYKKDLEKEEQDEEDENTERDEEDNEMSFEEKHARDSKLRFIRTLASAGLEQSDFSKLSEEFNTIIEEAAEISEEE